MRAPVAFVTARHKLTHPDEGPAAIARHCNLHDGSVRAAVRKLEAQEIWTDQSLLHWIQTISERPSQKRLYFQIPNPEHFLRSLSTRHWISGEFAAAAEGYDLVPERLFLYVHPEDVASATQAALHEFAKVAAPAAANLVIAIPDPWLYLDLDADFVERGQRLLDYAESRHIQLLRELNSDRAL